MRRKKKLCALLAFLMVFLTAFPAAAEDEERPIGTVRFSIDPPLCGHVPDVMPTLAATGCLQCGQVPN